MDNPFDTAFDAWRTGDQRVIRELCDYERDEFAQIARMRADTPVYEPDALDYQRFAEQCEQYNAPRIIGREDVPAGSFRYGQLADNPELDAEPDCWLVGYPCWKGEAQVLCVHWRFLSLERAIETARATISHYPTIVRPAA